MKPGRNRPCPCGSGRKYKKCCLPRHEERAREIHQLELAELAAGAPDEMLEDDFDPYDEDAGLEAPPLDSTTIRSIRYARGFVKRLDDAWDERKLEITVWTAPGIPQAILDAIAREAIGELEGTWGDPRTGTPIQVDTLEIELDNDLVSVDVFNRVIALVHTDSEELRRLHRVLEVLRKTAGGTAGHGEAQQIPTAGEVRAAPAFGLDDALRQHRNQGGACELCGAALKRQSAARHYEACAPAHDPAKGRVTPLIRLRVTSPYLRGYWLDVEVGADAKLEALDRVLRLIWLECCGHLSKFSAGNVEYFSRGYELNAWKVPGLMMSPRIERSMNVRLGDALPPPGESIRYEYDFGSTTPLAIKVTGERRGPAGRPAVRALGRNTPLVWPCAQCGEAASLVCTICEREPGANPFACDAHAGDSHVCGEDAYLPVVNSPRMGVCGYSGGGLT